VAEIWHTRARFLFTLANERPSPRSKKGRHAIALQKYYTLYAVPLYGNTRWSNGPTLSEAWQLLRTGPILLLGSSVIVLTKCARSLLNDFLQRPRLPVNVLFVLHCLRCGRTTTYLHWRACQKTWRNCVVSRFLFCGVRNRAAIQDNTRSHRVPGLVKTKTKHRKENDR